MFLVFCNNWIFEIIRPYLPPPLDIFSKIKSADCSVHLYSTDTEMSAHERLVSGFLLHAITVISLNTLNIIFKVSNFTPIIFLGKTTYIDSRSISLTYLSFTLLFRGWQPYFQSWFKNFKVATSKLNLKRDWTSTTWKGLTENILKSHGTIPFLPLMMEIASLFYNFLLGYPGVLGGSVQHLQNIRYEKQLPLCTFGEQKYRQIYLNGRSWLLPQFHVQLVYNYKFIIHSNLRI